MKKIFVLLFVVLGTQLFACGGCTDSYIAPVKSAEAIAKYNTEESEIALQLVQMKTYFDGAILAVEEQNLKENENLKALAKNKALKEQKQGFILNVQNQIQSIINNIEGQ